MSKSLLAKPDNVKFENWTVLETGLGTPKNEKWRCECSCGEEALVNKYNILYGKSKGCRKCSGRRMSKENNGNWKGFGNISGEVYRQAFWGAKARNIAFEITKEDLDILWKESNGICKLTGLELELGYTASLDRIDSSKGYTKDNIQWVHKDINKMKNNFKEVYFIFMCRQVSGVCEVV